MILKQPESNKEIISLLTLCPFKIIKFIKSQAPPTEVELIKMDLIV